ncbi:hypothetical protein [Bartonella silvatica]|uniref:hypothetical protein n=1 Tax=Bartonella silvatica TaxID=357760 RepID=UPI00339AD9F2
MNSLAFILLLVSCSDDFNSCYSNNKMVKIYQTAQACEQSLIPSTKKFASYGQQIFAQCTSTDANLQKQKIKLTWSVTNRGNFFLKSENISDQTPQLHEANIVSTPLPLSYLLSTNLLHKKP